MSNQERIKELLEFIRYDNPRAASILKYTIGNPAAESTFQELMTYSGEHDKEGFDLQVFSAINELHDLHLELMRT